MKTAVIGLGVIGRVHVDVLDKMGNRPAAVCDVDAERMSVCPQAAQYSDYRRMLVEVKPDVVHVCTPHDRHADMIVDALERNINVLCEKPLCIRREDIPRILAAEKRSKAILGVCLQNRYNPANRYVKQFLADKTVLGGVGNVVWHRDAAYYRADAWRGKRATEGGGVLINQAIHTLDLLEWFIGEPQYATASVCTLRLQKEIEVEDTAAVLYTGGANFTFFATNGSAVELPVEITLKTENEHIKICNDTVIVNGEVARYEQATRVLGKSCYGTGHEGLIADFYDCVANGQTFWIDGAEGAKVVKLVLAAYESGGKKVSVEA